MKLKASFVFVSVLLWAEHVRSAQNPLFADSQASPQSSAKRAITPELSAFVEDLTQKAGIPGVTLGVIQLSEGEEPLVELDAWGRKTETGDGHDLTPNALFDLASCSKAFLASSIGVLMDDFALGRNVTPLPDSVARFDWSTKVGDLLPDEWELADEWASQKATLRDALSHVTGMPRHDYSYAPGGSPRSVVHALRHLRPAYELRQKWSYNNMMYKMGAYLISKYANTTYTEFATSRLFKPMNMSSTTFWPDEATAEAKLTQAWTKFGRLIPFWFTDDIIELMAGPGGVISSADDMVKWIAVLLNSGVDPVSNKTIVPRATFDEMTTAHAIVEGKGAIPEASITGYGIGWNRFSYQGHEVVTHTGAIPGFSTRVAFLPSDGLGLVVLANADEKATANEAIMLRIAEDVLGLRRIDRVVTMSSEGKAVYIELVERDTDATTSASRQVPTLSLSAYAGTYSSPGYGAFVLCAPASDSHYCRTVQTDFEPFQDSAQDAASSLYAAWPRIWSTHLRLAHRDGDTFDADFTALFPHGYGANTTAFETSETGESEGRAVFVLEGEGAERRVKGFGLIIDEDAVNERRRYFDSVENYADAWFERV